MLARIGSAGPNCFSRYVVITKLLSTSCATMAMVPSATTAKEPQIGMDCFDCKNPLPPLSCATEWIAWEGCRHRMHASCYQSWIKKNTACPVPWCTHQISIRSAVPASKVATLARRIEPLVWIACFLFFTLLLAYQMGYHVVAPEIWVIFFRQTLVYYGCRCSNWIELPLQVMQNECHLYRLYSSHSSWFDDIEHGAELFSEINQRLAVHCEPKPDESLLEWIWRLVTLPWHYAYVRGVLDRFWSNGMAGWEAHMIDEIKQCRGPRIQRRVCSIN